MIKTDPDEYFENKNLKLTGIYKGVVEDNSSDPEKMGRCKIRIIGVHTPKKTKTDTEGIPTNELPWSEPALGLFEGSVSGFGAWTVPLQGSHVFVFFEGGNPLKPRYFASIPGKPTSQTHGFTSSEGFSDPDSQYPIESISAPHNPNGLNESDFHKLARGESGNTIVESKNSNRDKGVSIANNGTWDEPNSYYNTQYPHNKVFATNSGITIEIDDTKNEERIHIYHPGGSGSYVEINKDGNVITRNANDKYEIVNNDKKKHVMNNYDRMVDNNRTSKVGTNNTEVVGVSNKEEIGGDYTLHVKGKLYISADGGVDIWGGSNINQDAPQIHLNDGIASKKEI